MGRVLALCYPGGDHVPRIESKLLEYPANVLFGGALRYRELLGNLAIGYPLIDGKCDLLLAGREPARSSVERWLRLLGLSNAGVKLPRLVL